MNTSLFMKAKIISFVLFSIFAISLSFFAGKAYAANPIPGYKVPCEDEREGEFHSLRPYQSSPCGDSPKAYFCASDVVIYEPFHSTERCEGLCPVDIHQEAKEYAVEISDASLPIYGNTENVKNVTNTGDEFDDAQKLNEYVSWYLSGVSGRAEYGEVTTEQLVNFSGPLKKLLPSMIQDAQRIKIIESVSKEETFADTESSVEASTQITERGNHNQVVACESGGKAVPCPDGKELRLADWEEDLSILRAISNLALNLVGNIPGLGDLISNVATDAWNKRIPPLPWDDGTGEAFKEEIDYQKAYNEWRGKSCIIIPGIKKLICIENPGVTNTYADLYQYVPLANSSDKNAKMPIMGVQIKGLGGAEIDIEDPKYGILLEPINMFAHTLEASTNLTQLADTYTPLVCDENGKCEKIAGEVDANVETGYNEKNECNLVNVRSNPGDNLFVEHEPSEIRIKVTDYNVTQLMCDEELFENIKDINGNIIDRRPTGEFKCSGSVQILIREEGKHPYATEVWNDAVADTASIFRKTYPKIDENAPVSCISNIPGVSSAVYTPIEGADEITVVDPNGKRVDPENAQLFFPHIGSVYEYFLKGIQTALRPKGFGDQPISGQYCDNIECGELPKLPKPAGSCNLGSVSSRVGELPNSLKDIISAAAETYKVPPDLIVAVMFGEGLFNPGRFNWTEENVKNWATCQPIPNCHTEGDDNFMGFFSPVWERIADKIEPDLKKLDPNRKRPSQCNLLDAIYGAAYNLHENADGGGGMPAKCFNIGLKGSVPTSCDWKEDGQYASAIQGSENGYDPGCLTLENSCATGGGKDALCPGLGDTCETKDSRYTKPSHFACLWDVSHGN